MLLLLWLVVLGTSIGTPAIHAQEVASNESPQEFFDRFVALGGAYDASVADLYADDALIQSVRRYPDGRARTFRFVGVEYKRIIASAMPLARRRGDRDRYSNVTISMESDRPHIRCRRYN